MANFIEKAFAKGVEGTGISDIYNGIVEGDVDKVTKGLRTASKGPRVFNANDPIRDSGISNSSSFSGTDCIAMAQINDQLIMLGNVETFSYSIFREKMPVRVLGRSHPKGYTAGGRTISGSFVFVVFDRSPLYDIMSAFKNIPNPTDRYTSPVPDQLPPIDIILWFGNEYREHQSLIRLFAVEFIQEGQVHSINDIYSENTMQYVARDIDLMVNYAQIRDFKDKLFERQMRGLFTDSYLASMLEYKRDIEKRINDCNTTIQRIYTEMGRKNVATLGVTALWGNKDLRAELKKQLAIKEGLLSELDSINNQVIKYESKIYGYNAQHEDSGLPRKDYFGHAPYIGPKPS